MACKEFDELILRDLDGEIASGDKPRLKDHLDTCTTCKAEHELFGRIDEAIRRCSTPAAPRRDFADEALRKAEAAQTVAPRRIRRRVSGSAWMALSVTAIILVLGLIGVLLWMATRPAAGPTDTSVLPPVKIDIKEPVIAKGTTDTTVPTDRTLTPAELRQIYKFGDLEPVRYLVEAIVQTPSARSLPEKLKYLEQALLALIDGLAESAAYGLGPEESDHAEAIAILVQGGIVPLLGRVKDADSLAVLTDSQSLSLVDRLSKTYFDLLKFVRELPQARKADVERVLALCSEAREAARVAGTAGAVRTESDVTTGQPTLLRELAAAASLLARGTGTASAAQAMGGGLQQLASAAAAAARAGDRMDDAAYLSRLSLRYAEEGLAPVLLAPDDTDAANDPIYAAAADALVRSLDSVRAAMDLMPETQRGLVQPAFERASQKAKAAAENIGKRTEKGSPPKDDKKPPDSTETPH
jgi:hypothetical protein